MRILAFDTSGETCSVCVQDRPVRAEGTVPRITYAFKHERRLSERLNVIIEFVLRDAGLTLPTVDAFVVGLGPGSFTGVRVGVTLAKTFALALEKPLIGVSSLDAMAHSGMSVSRLPKVVVVPTRRTEAIVGFYRAGESTPICEPEVLPHTAIRDAALAHFATDDFLLTGEIPEDLRGLQPSDRVYPTYPSAATLALMAVARLESGNFDDPDSLLPLYIAPSPVG